MTDSATPTTDVITTDDDVSTDDEYDLSAVKDNSRIGNRDKFRDSLARLFENLKTAASRAKSATAANKALAESRCDVREEIFLANQHPDWRANGDLYKQVVGAAENRMLAKVDAASRVAMSNAVRQHVKWTYLPRAIGRYCLRTNSALADLAAEILDDDGNIANEERFAELLGAPTPAFKKAVRAEYNSTKPPLVPPDAFLDAPKGTGGGPGSGEPKNTQVAVKAAMSEVQGITLDLAVPEMWRGVSGIVARMAEEKSYFSSVKDRPAVEHAFNSLATVASLGAKMLHGSITPAELDSLDKFLFSPPESK